MRDIEGGIGELNVEKGSSDEQSQEDGGVSLGDSPEDQPESAPAEQEKEPTSKGMLMIISMANSPVVMVMDANDLECRD